MAASGLLRERDLRGLTAVVEDGLRDDPGPAVPWAVLHRLHQLIPADGVSFEEADLQNRQAAVAQHLFEGEHRCFDGPDEPEPVPEIWVARETFLPYGYWARTGDVAAVLRWSDFYSQTELKNQPFYDLLRQDTASDTRSSCRCRRPRAGLGRSGSSAPTVTSVSGIGSPCNCCGPTCTRSTSTPNAAATERRT